MTILSLHADQLCALDDFTVLHIRGADARSFMQAQLTNAVEDLTTDYAVLAGFCQAKGRLQATMMVWADPLDQQNLYAFLHQSIAESVRKRLSMFLLRAKAELVISPLKLYGVFNAPTAPVVLPTQQYTVQHLEQGTLISAPNEGEKARAWLISNPSLETERSAQDWLAADIYAGLAWIQEPSYEMFLPQDINLDIIGGVSFKKGCFPGQEVVARLHYRSTAKRRAVLGVMAAPNTVEVVVGMDIFDAAQPDRPFGRIINVAYDTKQAVYALLMEAPFEDIEQKSLHLANGAGPAIEVQSLPYNWEIAKY